MASAVNANRAILPRLPGGWWLLAGFSALAIPTGFSLADETWSRDSGVQGPIVIATGAWLILRQFPELRRLGAPGAAWLTTLLLVPSLALYVFGRAFDFITFEAGGLYGVGVAMLHAKFGTRILVRNWFPLLYLAFAIPPPSIVIDEITAPLKQFVSFVATRGLHFFGFPVARQGVTIFVAQYQLLVEDACSGMNSLIGLTAISLLYIYLLRSASFLYSVFLAGLVIPIAIFANIIRIVVLILLTYFFGDAVAQSFLHMAAGLSLFGISLLLIFGIDKLLGSIGFLKGRQS